MQNRGHIYPPPSLHTHTHTFFFCVLYILSAFLSRTPALPPWCSGIGSTRVAVRLASRCILVITLTYGSTRCKLTHFRPNHRVPSAAPRVQGPSPILLLLPPPVLTCGLACCVALLPSFDFPRFSHLFCCSLPRPPLPTLRSAYLDGGQSASVH